MKHLKLFKESLEKQYSEKEVVGLIVEISMDMFGDEWVPQEDDNFINWLRRNHLLETFEREYPLDSNEEY